MNDALEQHAAALAARFGDSLKRLESRCGELGYEVPAPTLLEVCRSLRDEEAFGYEQLIDLAGVDYLTYGRGEWDTASATGTGFSRAVERPLTPALSRGAGEGARSPEAGAKRLTAGEGMKVGDERPEEEPRFAVVYHLLSVRHNRRLRLRAWCETGEPPMLPSVNDVWSSANWFEREAFDLFGIVFREHPDLRRILTDYGFVGHPFRKDFPLIGNVEVRYDPGKGRVVYEPVAIEPRTLVPRVIREDNRYERALREGAKRG
jgi:NADH-quinone oxidoreductase subunit C